MLTIDRYGQEIYAEDVRVLVTSSNLVNSTISMAPIPELSVSLAAGRYQIEFTPHYNVNATTTGTGWNFQGGTAILGEYSFRSVLPSTATANYNNNYASRSQNFSVAQTSRLSNNRGSIIAEFVVTSPGTVIPHFRSEISGAAVTLLAGSVMKVTKY